MDNTSENGSTNLSRKDLEKTLTGVIIVLIVATLLAVTGFGFGIYSTIQVNRTTKYLEESLGADLSDVDEADTIEETYGKPSSAEDIESVYITYNNGMDYINIYNSDEIEYFTYDDNDEYVGETTETSTADIIKYIFDNDLEYLGDNEYTGDEIWSVEIATTEDTYSFVGGTGETPEWLNELLNKLDANSKGYQSKKLSS